MAQDGAVRLDYLALIAPQKTSKKQEVGQASEEAAAVKTLRAKVELWWILS